MVRPFKFIISRSQMLMELEHLLTELVWSDSRVLCSCLCLNDAYGNINLHALPFSSPLYASQSPQHHVSITLLLPWRATRSGILRYTLSRSRSWSTTFATFLSLASCSLSNGTDIKLQLAKSFALRVCYACIKGYRHHSCKELDLQEITPVACSLDNGHFTFGSAGGRNRNKQIYWSTVSRRIS